MIRLGNTYTQKYLNHSFIHNELKPKDGFMKSYLIRNRTDAPVFRGVLNVLLDGRAIIKVNYVSYSGVPNKYENYFDFNGREIINDKNSTTKEKKFYDELSK